MDIKDIKKDFIIFRRKLDGKGIVYLDSAATSLKPRPVVEAVRKYYEEYTANIHRGIYRLSEEATAAYEGAREKVAKFIGAPHQNGAGRASGVVFVRNATEAINLVMYAWGTRELQRGDEIVCTVMEHHANFVPWQVLSGMVGARLKVVQIDENGLLDIDVLERAITKKTKLVALSHVSNVLGTINPIKEIIEKLKTGNSKLKTIVDGAQAVPHMQVDVNDLGCDWYVFSGHKMLGPTGIGVLWGKNELLEEMDPFMFGGEMIREVRLEGSTFNKVPYKFEAGTPNISGAIGLGAAVDYLEKLGTHHSMHPSGMGWVREHEKELVRYALKELKSLKGIRVYGPEDIKNRGGVISFTVEGIHPHDVAQVLDEDNVYVRAGHHCAMPLHTFLGLNATVRVSFYVYNTKEDVDKLILGIKKAVEKFKR